MIEIVNKERSMKITFLVEKWLFAFSIFLGIEQKKKKKKKKPK